MKKALTIILACFLIAATFAGLTVLASWAIYKQDMRACIADGGSRIYCEVKLK